MERLTTMCDGRPALVQGYAERFTESSLFYMMLNRLAAYEDTMPLERAQELAQAEKDGRLMVLPACKAGDRIFRIVDMEPHLAYKNFVTFEDVLPFGVPVKCMLGGASIIPIECFGKTVFLTREEAEEALKKREADNEAD